MYQVDDKPETIHLYVVREKEKQPFVVLPVLVALLCIGTIIGVTYYLALHPVYAHKTLTIPAVALTPQTFRATTNVIPTGIRTYPATYAHGVLTFTNGSIIGQSIPAGLTIDDVMTDQAVYVPAGSADGYGYARAAAHALIPGKDGNFSTLAINAVIGSSLYIRNLSAFSGGRDAYSVTYVTEQDRQTAIKQARSQLTTTVIGLHYPCTENLSGVSTKMAVTWHCQFVTYHVPSYMRVLRVRLIGKNLLIDVAFMPPSVGVWVK
jgi:hypothetical protein